MDDAHAGVVADHREIGGQRRVDLADRGAHIGERRACAGLGGRERRGIGFGVVGSTGRSATSASSTRQPGDRAPQRQVDDADMRRPRIRPSRRELRRAGRARRPRRRRPAKSAPGSMRCWWPRKIASIPPASASASPAFSSAARRTDPRYAGVAEGDDHVGAGRAAGRDMQARRLDEADRRRPAGEMAHVPAHDLRRDEADDADVEIVASRPVVARAAARGSSRA